jgi:sulfur-carrier protein
MPIVRFTQNIQRHVPCPPGQVQGATVAGALEAVFAGNPVARSYVLDDQGCLRKHMIVFVDGEPVRDRDGLSDTVGENTEIYVMQALSGG